MAMIERSTSCRRSAARVGPRRRPRACVRSRRSAARGSAAARAGRRCGPRVRGGATRAPRRGPRSRLGLRLARGRRRPRPARRHRAPEAPCRARRSAPARRRCGPPDPWRRVRGSRARPAVSRRSSEHPGEPLGGGGEAGVVLVEPAFERVLVLDQRPVERDATVGEFLLGGCERRLRRCRPMAGVLERGRSRAAHCRADPPTCRRQAVTVGSHDHRRGMGDRGVDRGLDTVDPHGAADQRVEQA